MKKDILMKLAKYCSGTPDLDTLNKISELSSVTAMKLKGNLDPMRLEAFNEALHEWVEAKATPRTFKSGFRGVK